MDATFKPSYLATAMRLSIPGVGGRDPTEEEIMNDVQKLGFKDVYDYPDPDYSSTVEKRYLEWPGKRSSSMYNDDQSYGMEKTAYTIEQERRQQQAQHEVIPQQQKRYHEFLGKRNIEGGKTTENRMELFKKWSEFIGKRNEGRFSDDTEFITPKRYLEFVGKRQSTLYRSPPSHKRYHEFLG